MEDPEGNNMDENGKNRQELLRRIEVQRVNIGNFIRRVRPRSVRLANTSIIGSAIAAVLTAGPAFGGLSFAGAVQHALSLSSSSTVWRVLCLVAMLVSLVATISVQLGKSQDMAAQLRAAEACDTELEGLQTLLELQHLPVRNAAELYRNYIAKIPFVRIESVASELQQG